MTYEELMALPDVSALPPTDALQCLGELIDHSEHRSDLVGAERALAWCQQLDGAAFTEIEQVEFEYFWANAWAAKQHILHVDPDVAWAWEQPELENQVLRLRRALNHPSFGSLPKMRRCQILTNLANQMNTAGRFVEALDYWSRALELVPAFWMARGNRGYALSRYAQALHDGGHEGTFFLFAHDDLGRTVRDAAKYDKGGQPAAQAYFRNAFERMTGPDIEGLRKSLNLDGHGLGRSKAEQAYRRWCLRERLFLNPLNDLGPHTIAAHDILTLPSFTVPLGTPPVLIGFFNQMKQEFASARWLQYEAQNAKTAHFSDRGVFLYNTLDYPAYSLAVEKMKFAYRAAYSLFDKIAYFLNSYMELGIKPTQVSFSRVWRTKDNQPIRPEFEQAKNWPFRGLYWLSKDLFDEEFHSVAEPEARALKKVRDHLEHKYLKVHEMLMGTPGDGDLFTDTLAYSVTRADLEKQTLHLLKLARAALIYLALGMHREEQRRDAKKPAKLRGSMELDRWEDRWKL